MARTRRKRKKADLRPGAEPEDVPGQLALFTLTPGAAGHTKAASGDERTTTSEPEGEAA